MSYKRNSFFVVINGVIDSIKNAIYILMALFTFTELDIKLLAGICTSIGTVDMGETLFQRTLNIKSLKIDTNNDGEGILYANFIVPIVMIGLLILAIMYRKSIILDSFSMN